MTQIPRKIPGPEHERRLSSEKPAVAKSHGGNLSSRSAQSSASNKVGISSRIQTPKPKPNPGLRRNVTASPVLSSQAHPVSKDPEITEKILEAKKETMEKKIEDMTAEIAALDSEMQDIETEYHRIVVASEEGRMLNSDCVVKKEKDLKELSCRLNEVHQSNNILAIEVTEKNKCLADSLREMESFLPLINDNQLVLQEFSAKTKESVKRLTLMQATLAEAEKTLVKDQRIVDQILNNKLAVRPGGKQIVCSLFPSRGSVRSGIHVNVAIGVESNSKNIGKENGPFEDKNMTNNSCEEHVVSIGERGRELKLNDIKTLQFDTVVGTDASEPPSILMALNWSATASSFEKAVNSEEGGISIMAPLYPVLKSEEPLMIQRKATKRVSESLKHLVKICVERDMWLGFLNMNVEAERNGTSKSSVWGTKLFGEQRLQIPPVISKGETFSVGTNVVQEDWIPGMLETFLVSFFDSLKTGTISKNMVQAQSFHTLSKVSKDQSSPIKRSPEICDTSPTKEDLAQKRRASVLNALLLHQPATQLPGLPGGQAEADSMWSGVVDDMFASPTEDVASDGTAEDSVSSPSSRKMTSTSMADPASPTEFDSSPWVPFSDPSELSEYLERNHGFADYEVFMLRLRGTLQRNRHEGPTIVEVLFADFRFPSIEQSLAENQVLREFDSYLSLHGALKKKPDFTSGEFSRAFSSFVSFVSQRKVSLRVNVQSGYPKISGPNRYLLERASSWKMEGT
eukprot:GHVP01069447.1.p1 GENE.GHVP01069447.1~~GHVP01069447.1.p1  ORF type:complete len:741 (-),score=149.74 GHVP01069447.1:4535-6757(-)